MDDLTEEEKVEQLKLWWKENGKFILSGLVIGAVLLVGYYQWQDHKRATAQAASALFDQVNRAAETDDIVSLQKHIAELETDYAKSPYLTQSKLRFAQVQMQRGEVGEAEKALIDVRNAEGKSVYGLLSRLRLAQVYMYQDRPQDALAELEGVDAGRYAPLYAVARADAHAAMQAYDKAREAYSEALLLPGQPQIVDTTLVSMKLAKLPMPAAKSDSNSDSKSDSKSDAAADDTIVETPATDEAP